uniref:Fe2OG dioxygenase domain-containing protein n=1 Tax=Leptocylindrus danicus TaxID=163516 RepID=A0A7S2L3K0_9STRA|mmetsp:Transcript_3090/g.4493  ORF Transcript_3090/g.4493 Transcript_3090/m.4493 type:complete len:643 (+) Transcript_3090:80-2008(+)
MKSESTSDEIRGEQSTDSNMQQVERDVDDNVTAEVREQCEEEDAPSSSEDEEEEGEDDQDDDVQVSVGSGMVLKSFAVAVFATMVSFVQLNGGISNFIDAWSTGTLSTNNKTRKSYSSANELFALTPDAGTRMVLPRKRTSNMDFCLVAELDGTDGNCIPQPESSSNLEYMNFNIKAPLMDFVTSSYDLEYFPYEDDDASAQKTRRYKKGRALVYKDPPVGSYYVHRKDESTNYDEAVEPSFTGFAGKFINLSPKPVLFFWDGNEPILMDRILPYEAVGTSTFPGHQFFFTPEYDRQTAVARFFITADTKVMVYDPKPDLETLSAEHREKYLAQLANLDYAREYLVITKRQWLAMFPRPPPKHFMWNADYFFQEHSVETRETHFLKMPSQAELARIQSFEGEYGRANPSEPRPLSIHRERGTRKMTLRTISCSPRVFEIDHFLSDVEVEHILSRATSLKRSTTVGDNDFSDEFDAVDDTRTSKNTWLNRHDSPIIDAIYRRAADLMRIDEVSLRFSRHGDEFYSAAESLQLVHYNVGQEYTPHHDFTYPSMESGYQAARFATLLLYLNDDMAGGETVFPKAVNAQTHSGLQVKPEKGKAVLFYNMLPDGNFDDLSQHAGYPVKEGQKWLANLWVWDPFMDAE